MAKPKRTLRNETLKSALRNFLVPCIAERYFVCSLRALWDVDKDDLPLAAINIWEKRCEVENILKGFEQVNSYF